MSSELEQVFISFAGGQGMDGRSFQKCVKASGLIGRGLSQTDTDLIFAKCKAKKIGFADFQRCLDDVAGRRNLDKEEVMDKIIAAAGPVYNSGTTKGGSGTAGPERFFYDKTSYTGTHTKGGPTTAGSGTATEGYAELSGLIRREHKQDDWMNQRKQTEDSSSSSGQAQQTPAPSTVTMRRSSSSSSVNNGLGSTGRPRSRGASKPVAKEPSGASAPSEAERPKSRGGVKIATRGPERFFYDQNTYTGSHTKSRGISGKEPPSATQSSKAPVLLGSGGQRSSEIGGRLCGCGNELPADSAFCRKCGTRWSMQAEGGRDAAKSGARASREVARAQVTVTSPAPVKKALPAVQAAASRPLRGPERFFYDKSSYTGVHQAGGPSTIDTHGGSKVGDLSEITRSGLGPKQGR